MPSPLISPMLLLLMAAGVTAAAVIASNASRRRRQQQLLGLAREWKMQYSDRDVFELAARVAGRLPVVGAADVQVRDLIYATEPAGHRCIFCAEYTSGVVRARSRTRCVISVLESRLSTPEPGPHWISFEIAPQDLPLLDQYRSLKARA